MPGAHSQGLAAAGPVEQIVARYHADQARAIQIHPEARGFRLDRPAMIQEYGAGSEGHEQRGQKHRVVQQRRQAAAESGTGAGGHDAGAGGSFFFGVDTGEDAGFELAAPDDAPPFFDAPPWAAPGGGAFGTSNFSRGRKIASKR